ncbi:MAG: hypothetical protein PHI34_15260 [Acidobacteriota bacterium]|nr:hypothetical protein [Acidobacteriota bacterium]
MLQERRSALTAIFLISGIFLGFGLFANIPGLYKGFLVGDQAVYYIMAQSLAFDGDLEYTAKDLVRFNEDFWAGPNGIFLKKVVRDGRERLYYAKSYAYPLFAAPFVRLLGPGGPIVFNGLLLFLILLMGWNYFALANGPGLALGKMAAYLGASIAFLYALWITPDFFNMFLVFTVLFLWRYKAEVRKAEVPTPAAAAKPEGVGRPGPWKRFLLSGNSDYLAAAVAGLAVFSKPTNILLGAAFLLSTLLVGKKFWKAVALGLVLIATTGVFFVANRAWTTEWNYQGGQRKSFVFQFPLEHKDVTFDNLALTSHTMTTDGYAARLKSTAKLLPFNLFWYVFGRFTGAAWYFFPALFYFLLFLRGRKNLDAWLILAAAAGQILAYVIMMPDNYGGGGGSMANRYFMNIYPMFLFLPGVVMRRRETVWPWVMAAVFVAPILLSPFATTLAPSVHAKRFPYTLLPVEYSLINDLPTNADPDHFRQRWGMPFFNDRFVYFLNDNFNARTREENGWWTNNDKTADLVLRTFFPVSEVVVHLLNNPRRDNEITVRVDGKTKRILLQPMQRGELRFPVGDGFRISESHQYRIKARAAKGSIPYHEDPTSLEKRHLGVYFELELVPRTR